MFRGRLVEVQVDSPLPSTTVVLDKTMAVGPDRTERAGLSPMPSEDPLFGGIYRVLASDPVAARALLTPATMRLLLGMADGQAFHPPSMLSGRPVGLVRDRAPGRSRPVRAAEPVEP